MPALSALHYKYEEEDSMPKYDPDAQKEVGKAIHEMKEGKLKSGAKSQDKVTSRKQAIAIGLSKARKKGDKVPRKKDS